VLCLTDTSLYIYICVKHFGMANIKKNNPRVNLLTHTSLMGALGLGLSGLWGRLEGDGGGDCSFGDGDLASEVGPIPENKNKTITQ